jgi:GT2 family glycosyltransferase
MNFSIVIPTYNREKDLSNCLDSILLQSKRPNELIIIDDGNLRKDFIDSYKNKFKEKVVEFIYYKKDHNKERRGSSESRNKALELANNEIFFIFDDDVVLEKNFCEIIMNQWEKNKDNEKLICIGGIIKNSRKKLKLEKYFYNFFGIRSKYAWDVNRIGFQLWDEDIKKPSIGYYAHGGASSYNLLKTKELKFSIFSGGRTALEDVDFCLRAKSKKYQFLIEPKAQLYHYHSQISREGKYLMGFKESYNRKLIFKTLNKKRSIFLWIWFYFANFGWILRQFLVGNFRKGWGMVKGLFFD